MIFWLLASFFFICLQGFFSGMETGMVSIMLPRAEHAAKNAPSFSSKTVLFFLHHPDVMISTTLLGVNFSVVMASLSFKKFMENCGLGSGVAVSIAPVVLSLILLTAEIIPKNWFRQSPFARCSGAVLVLYVTYLCTKPVVLAFSALTAFLNRILSTGHTTASAESQMRESFRLFVRDSEGYGALDAATAAVLDHAMMLPGIKLLEIAVPLEKTPVIPVTASVQEAFECARRANADKISVSDDGQIVGIFNAYDAIVKLDEAAWSRENVSRCMSKVHVLQENDDLTCAVEMSRRERVGLFVIADQTGKQRAVLAPEVIAEILFR